MRAGNFQHLLNEPVEQVGLHITGGLVVYLLALPAADNQPCTAQLAQMVGYGGTAHIHHGREIDDALLTVAEDPEQLDPAAVAQLAQQFGHLLEVTGSRAVFHNLVGGLAMVMGQFIVFHCISSRRF